ncbi:response regulator of citrate/malate metabolism [Georgenia soli]|uniref:Transcriptional regulatory protein n=1 Tax=Georgenia soli TaxID=638953 RepID=A0A2A9ELD4_9MICO|nr:response regulator [Georgenia soli]PFG39029.1 response regulator of citrate/malate metabolism [Georgenia soli]
MIGVLIVDDDYMVARIHEGFVKRCEGVEVVGVAHDPAAALEAAARLQPDLVLLDVFLPGASGLDILAGMREAAPDMDVIVVTAAREAETVKRAVRGGAVQYLMKPFTFADLRERLQHYRQTHRALPEGKVPEQTEVDRLFAAPRTTAATLPKGLSVETLQLVAQVLSDAGGDLSAAEAAELAGISRVSARRYLEHLTDTGRAEVRLRYGEVGRPERRYVGR